MPLFIHRFPRGINANFPVMQTIFAKKNVYYLLKQIKQTLTLPNLMIKLSKN